MKEKEYEKVPNILSGKDLDYLSDLFNWNYGAYKAAINMESSIEDNELYKHVKKASKLFLNNINIVLDILEEGKANE